MTDKHRPGLLWWWNALVVMSAIAWGTLIYFMFAGPPRMPYTMYLPAAEAEYHLIGAFNTQRDYYRGF